MYIAKIQLIVFIFTVFFLLYQAKAQVINNHVYATDIARVRLYGYTKTEVIDGDDLNIEGIRVRLYGIDAPEYDQECEKNKVKYHCGQIAKQTLESLISKDTYCVIKGFDMKYKRPLAVCYNNDISINAELVKQGLAIAYSKFSKDYISQEKFAKKNKKGIWQGKFINPEEHRKMKKAHKN